MNGKNRRILKKLSRICLCAGCLAPAPLFAETLTWNGSESAWSTASNWLIGDAVSTRVPGTGDTIAISAGNVTSGTLILNTNTLNLSGGQISITGTDLTLHNGSVVNQSGGTLIFTSTGYDRWLNIGETEGKVAYYNMTGGSITCNLLYVGRRGEGHLTVSGDSTITTNRFTVGYAGQKSGNSTAALNGGTITVNDTRVGCESNESGSNMGTSLLTINGAVFNTNGEVCAGYYANSLDSAGVTTSGTINMTAGTWNAANNVMIAFGDVGQNSSSKNIGTINLSGGTANFEKEVRVGWGQRATGIMNISDAAVTNFNGQVSIGIGVGTAGEMNISGGTNTFSKLLLIGSGGVSSQMNITGGTNTIKGHTRVGNTSEGYLKLTGGTTNFNISYNEGTANTLAIGFAAKGTMEIGGDAVVTVSGNDINLGSGGEGRLIQNGGSLTVNCWFNIGEASAGVYDMSGGTLRTNSHLVVGRRSRGTMNISGTAAVTAKRVYVGYFPTMSGGSQLTMTGGTLNGTNLYVANNPDHTEGGNSTSASVFTITGGTAVFSEGSNIGYGPTGSVGGIGVLNVGGTGNITFKAESNLGHSSRGNGTINVSENGVFTANEKFYLSIHGGTSETNVTGGTMNFNKDIGFAHGDNAVAELNISGGSVKVGGRAYLGDGVNSDADINVSGGELRFNNRVEGGYKSGAQTTINITGGTVYGPNADFLVGVNNGAVTKLIVNGGTYNQNSKGNLVVHSTTANGDVGNLVQLNSGTLDTLWLSLGQNGMDGGICTFDMTGGTLKIGNGDQNFRIGHNYNAAANISGGDVTVKGEIQVAHGGRGGTLNIYGSDAVVNASRMNAAASGNVNYIADGIEFNADGTIKPAMTNITISGNAVINSSVLVDTTNYNYDGVLFTGSLPTQTILTANGTLTWTPKLVETEGAWNVQKSDKSVELVLNEDYLAEAEVTGGSAIASGNFGEQGWIELTGDANESYELTVGLHGDGDVDDLIAWLESQMAEVNQGVEVTNAGGALTFSNLMLDADGLMYMNYDLSAFNLQNGADFSLSGLPEPSTWILLVTGAGLLLWRRRKQ